MRWVPDWRRARWPALWLAATQVLGLVVGAALVHAGDDRALAFRDGLVARAHASDASAIALDRGDRPRAMASDFFANAVLGGAPQAIGGLALFVPFVVGAFRGFVGGVVSVDAAHHSRLAEPASAAYFLGVVALQLSGYTIAAVGGVRAGLDLFRTRNDDVPRFLTIPRSALWEMLRYYAWSLPFFAVGSIVEFAWG